MNDQNQIVTAWEDAGRPHPFATFRDGYVAAQSAAGGGPLRSALTELVALQDMKKRMAEISAMPGYLDSTELLTEHDRLSSEYSQRRPVAWNAARAALAQPTSREASQDAEDAARYKAMKAACAVNDKKFVDVMTNHLPDKDTITEEEFDVAVDAARAATGREKVES